MNKSYLKLALLSHPDKINHPQASAVMHMISEIMEGLEDLLRYNDAMREQEEYIQRQEEPWREDKLIRKSQKDQNNKRNKLKWMLV